MGATLTQQIDETLDQLDNVESLCDLFFGRRQFTIYKNIAGSLRLLLTGSSGHVGLVETVLPAGGLWRLRKIPDPMTPADMLVLPAAVLVESGDAKVRVGNGTVTVKELNVKGGAVSAMDIGEMFESSSPALPIRDWLQQPFLRPTWTIRSFISAVANKDGGAHLDPNPTIEAMQRWGHLHWHLTAALARSVLPQVREQLTATYPSHVRPER